MKQYLLETYDVTVILNFILSYERKEDAKSLFKDKICGLNCVQEKRLTNGLC